MQSILNPYINFNGNTREAMTFYQTVFGGKLSLMTMEQGAGVTDLATKDNIMHADLRADNGMVLMAADDVGDEKSKTGNNCSVSLSGDNSDELKNYYNKLADGGTVIVPMAKSPWDDEFGMVTDKYGVLWLVNIAAKKD
jgi:PhnB protein